MTPGSPKEKANSAKQKKDQDPGNEQHGKIGEHHDSVATRADIEKWLPVPDKKKARHMG